MVTNNDLPPHRPLTAHQLASLKTGLRDKRSVRSIAHELDLRYDTYLAVAKGHGWIAPQTRPGIATKQEKHIVDLVLSGHDIAAVARLVGVIALPKQKLCLRS